MLRALALNDFRVRCLPRVLVDFQIGGIKSGSVCGRAANTCTPRASTPRFFSV
jgi:hypothetical protein